MPNAPLSPPKCLLRACAILAFMASSPAVAFTSCLANEENSDRLDGSGFHYTWTPLKSGTQSPEGGNLRSMLAAAGFTVTRESRGPGGVSVRAAPPMQDWAGTSIEFDVDPALGVVSASAVFPNRNLARYNFKNVACAVLEAVYPSGEQPPAKRSWFRKQHEVAEERENLLRSKFRQNLDWLYARALEAGRAIVVVPVLNVDEKYRGTGHEQDPVGLWNNLSSTTRWRREGADSTLRVGHHEGALHAGMPGFHHSFVADRARYLVYVVEPGRYTIDGTSIEMKRTVLPELRPGRLSAASKLGTVYLEPAKYTDFYRTQEWRDARFAEREVVNSYCSMAIAGGGPCVQWSNHTSTAHDLVAQAGYYDTPKAYAADVVRADTRLARPFASFEVKPGEAVVIDGFYAMHPSFSYDTARCASEARGVRCDLKDFVLARIPGKLDDLRSPSAMAVTANYPSLRAIFGRAVYRELEVVPEGDALVPGLGQLYGAAK